MRSKLFVRNRTGAVVAEVSDFIQFDAVLRDIDVGSWALRLPPGRVTSMLLEPGAGLILERDGRDLAAGPMVETEPKWSLDEDEVVVSGLTDMNELWNLIARPGPANWSASEGKAFNSAYDVRSGPAETVIKSFVFANTQNEDRRAPGVEPMIVAPDLGRGGDVTGRARFQYLGDFLKELAVLGGVTFDVVNRRFEVSTPRDLRKLQVFSLESGNLQSYAFKRSRPRVTDVLVAGGGELEDRTFVRASDREAEELWGAHVEVFRDERSTAVISELEQAGAQALIEGAELTTVDLRAIDVPSRSFGVDWNVGDVVTVEGIEAKVREVKITLDGNGEVVTPTIDSVTTVTAQSMISLYDAVRRQNRRINALERTR